MVPNILIDVILAELNTYFLQYFFLFVYTDPLSTLASAAAISSNSVIPSGHDIKQEADLTAPNGIKSEPGTDIKQVRQLYHLFY